MSVRRNKTLQWRLGELGELLHGLPASIEIHPEAKGSVNGYRVILMPKEGAAVSVWSWTPGDGLALLHTQIEESVRSVRRGA